MTIQIKEAALEELRSIIKTQNDAIEALHKAASGAGAHKQASAALRVTAATLVDTLVANEDLPATSRTNVMEKFASDHAAALEGFLTYVQNRGAERTPPAMGGADKSASEKTRAAGDGWGAAGDAFAAGMGL